MNKSAYFPVVLLALLIGSQPCQAGGIKAYVNRFSVSVPENREELKESLQTLLMSRLNSEEIQAVEDQADAEIQVAGSYIVFGTVFSLDAVVKTSAGLFIDRVFVQGDAQNELIPSVTEMAKRLRRSILKWNPLLASKATTEIPPLPVENIRPATVKAEPRPEAKPVNTPKSQKLPPSPKMMTSQKVPTKPFISERLPGAFNGIARGRTIAGKGTEIFMTGENSLRYYVNERSLQLLSEIRFEPDEKVIAIDVADLDQNKVPEIYVTIMKEGLPASQVYIPEGNVIRKIKDNIPYMLRGIALEGKEKKIFAQKMAANGTFSGDIYELVKSGDDFTFKNPLQLPLFGNLYNFNRFIDSKGKRFFVVAHPDGYLLVYSKDKKQLWKSRDKFGGSEALVCPPENSRAATLADSACSFYLPQRLLVTAGGEVITSRNTGLSISGDTRSYSKNTVVQLVWNGTSLEEKLRTEQSQNYLADFYYEDRTRELLLLEVEPQADSGRERGSRVVVKKAE